MEKNTEEVEISQIIRGRAAFYEFFSFAFRKPADERFVEIVRQFSPYFDAVASATEIKELQEGALKLGKFIEAADNSGNIADDLNRSYTTLFLLGGKSIPTCESVYTSPEKLMKQEPWEQITELYANNSFGMPEDFKEPEDHISMELLFMHYMTVTCADAFDDMDDEKAEKLMLAQKDFMYEHMLKWIPDFCNAVTSFRQDDILMLKEIALLLKGFLQYDKEFIDLILDN